MALLRIVKKSADKLTPKAGFVNELTMKNALFYLCILLMGCVFIMGFLLGFVVG